MDPLALAAVVGLVFAGKRLSDGSEEKPVERKPLPTTRPITRRDIDLAANARDHAKDAFDLRVMTPNLGRRIGDCAFSRRRPSLISRTRCQMPIVFHSVSRFTT